jgi:phage shock protein C
MNERLHRSRDERMLAGVAGGMADYWDADPTMVRLVWVLLAIFSAGLALVVYIVMAIVVPEEVAVGWPGQPTTQPLTNPMAGPAGQPGAPNPGSASPTLPAGWTPPIDRRAERRMARAAWRAERRARRDPSSLPLVIGGLLVAVGSLVLLRQWVPQVYFDWLGPVVLIALGGLLLVRAFASHDSPAGPASGWPAGPKDGAA